MIMNKNSFKLLKKTMMVFMILQHPQRSMLDCCRKTGMTYTTTLNTIHNWSRKGLLNIEKGKKFNRLSLTPKGQEVFNQLKIINEVLE